MMKYILANLIILIPIYSEASERGFELGMPPPEVDGEPIYYNPLICETFLVGEYKLHVFFQKSSGRKW